jgi:pilus assembly protein Flp/PilA
MCRKFGIVVFRGLFPGLASRAIFPAAIAGANAFLEKFPVRNFLTHQGGASAVEYGLLLAAIAGAVISIVFALGLQLQPIYTDICTAINNNVAC